jgi:hypothetical protein
MIVRDRPQRKFQPSLAERPRYVTEVEYLSPVTSSRYVLQYTLSHT